MKLISWNIQLCLGIDGSVDPARIAREARSHNPDVICFQEVARNFAALEGSAGEDYVTLALGRDFSDVSPIRGVIHGGTNHSLRVAVTVSPVDDDKAPATSAAPAMPE